tara:strand:- start:1466 stop:2176 length:711 start_codon:yes stop_codon:yes gene_type:complete
MKEKFFSQFGQDKFLDEEVFKGKREGFFVEVGAHDGMYLSNTCFFEKSREWKGVCVEPSSAATDAVNKRETVLSSVCVGDEEYSNEIVKFRQSSPMEISKTMFGEDEKYQHVEGKFYDKFKLCRTLDSILDEYAPTTQPVDYLSIDTEGCEYMVVKDFPFDKWKISAVTVANNFYVGTPEKIENRNKIKKLFIKNNFMLYKTFSLSEMDKKNWGKDFKNEILEDLYVSKDFIEKIN